jgi:hypothetical protein
MHTCNARCASRDSGDPSLSRLPPPSQLLTSSTSDTTSANALRCVLRDRQLTSLGCSPTHTPRPRFAGLSPGHAPRKHFLQVLLCAYTCSSLGGLAAWRSRAWPRAHQQHGATAADTGVGGGAEAVQRWWARIVLNLHGKARLKTRYSALRYWLFSAYGNLREVISYAPALAR